MILYRAYESHTLSTLTKAPTLSHTCSLYCSNYRTIKKRAYCPKACNAIYIYIYIYIYIENKPYFKRAVRS